MKLVKIVTVKSFSQELAVEELITVQIAKNSKKFYTKGQIYSIIITV